MSYQSALQTLQWSTCIDLENGVIHEDCLNFEPSKELEQRIYNDWENFQAQAIELGFDSEKHRLTYIDLSEGDYWDYAAHDLFSLATVTELVFGMETGTSQWQPNSQNFVKNLER